MEECKKSPSCKSFDAKSLENKFDCVIFDTDVASSVDDINTDTYFEKVSTSSARKFICIYCILANPTPSRGNLPLFSLLYRLPHFKAFLPLVGL